MELHAAHGSVQRDIRAFHGCSLLVPNPQQRFRPGDGSAGTEGKHLVSPQDTDLEPRPRDKTPIAGTEYPGKCKS